jgi:hypothetical protein
MPSYPFLLCRRQFDDDTSWSNGHDGGKTDNRPVVLTEGEYLTRITHETFYNYKHAAIAVEFESNKGRSPML